MSYLIFVALMLLVVSPVLIPLTITGAHATGSLWQKRKPFQPTESLEIRCTGTIVT
jgi:hypothetical protein